MLGERHHRSPHSTDLQASSAQAHHRGVDGRTTPLLEIKESSVENAPCLRYKLFHHVRQQLSAWLKSLTNEGVERQLTVRYTPQQNGVTERKNQTIVEMAKSMMHEKGLPKIFWAEAVYTAVYLSNRCPTTVIPNKTLFEAWSGRRPSVNHLKLGQVIISRDVQVDENALWNWEENKVEKKDILISTDKEDEIEPSTPDSSSSQPNDESSTDPTSSNSSSPSTTPKRHDLMYAASLLSRFMQSLSHFHLGAAKRVLRYIQGTTDIGLSFQKNHALNLVGYCDSDLGGSLDDMKSTSGYCFSFGSAIFSWLSKKQQSVAQSSAEAEYISASVATSQAIWLRRILADLGHHQIEGTVLYCDNKSAIAMAKNPVHHSRTRHIALKYHFIRQAIEDKEIQLEFCDSWNSSARRFLTAFLHREVSVPKRASIASCRQSLIFVVTAQIRSSAATSSPFLLSNLPSPLLSPTLIISVAAPHPFSSLTHSRCHRSSHPHSRILVAAAAGLHCSSPPRFLHSTTSSVIPQVYGRK
ncbi:hypothetical protein ZIOFF_032132 [Zingiber officinale]|uniref:Integrase catalytic domain-containing protein n=1 Tax=Zingiber officinale TaxID=94328 RepID=A0A8J5GHV7_ZINOF|nr:hypothetical protein ZIOFF_032132 [Zingiber officinale]